MPGIAVDVPSVLAMDRSVTAVAVVSVAESLAELVSTPADQATVAVLTNAPTPLTVPLARKVTCPPASTLIVALRLPLPLAAGQVEPALERLAVAADDGIGSGVIDGGDRAAVVAGDEEVEP